MTTDYTHEGVTSSRTAPEKVRAEFGDTVTALNDKVKPLRGALSTVRARSASGVSRVRNRPVPAAVAGALAVAGVVTAVILGRRRAAKTRSARSRWLPDFPHR